MQLQNHCKLTTSETFQALLRDMIYKWY